MSYASTAPRQPLSHLVTSLSVSFPYLVPFQGPCGVCFHHRKLHGQCCSRGTKELGFMCHENWPGHIAEPAQCCRIRFSTTAKHKLIPASRSAKSPSLQTYIPPTAAAEPGCAWPGTPCSSPVAARVASLSSRYLLAWPLSLGSLVPASFLDGSILGPALMSQG